MLDWLLIGIRFGLFLALAVLSGLSAFSLYGMPSEARGQVINWRPWLSSSAAVSLVLSAIWLVVTSSSMAGLPLWPVDRDALQAILTGSAMAFAWKVRMAALTLVLLATITPTNRRRSRVIVAFASPVAIATLPWTGHGAASEGAFGWLHLVADIMHLLASAAWVGALLGLVLLVTRRASRVDAAHLELTYNALHGFGAVGTLVVITIVASGLINGWMLVGIDNLGASLTTIYGRLLLAKLALFAAMLMLASLNRFQLTPRFERGIATHDHQASVRALRVSLAVEAGCVLTVLALVAWLGTLEPPSSIS